MKRSNRCTLVLLVGSGVAALAAAGLLARPSGATVADTTCRTGAIAVQATWSETYMIDNPDGTNAQATCSGVGSVTLTAVRPAAAAASASKLPAAGIWSYDHGPTLPATGRYATFQAFLHVTPGKSYIYSFAVVVTGGTCKKDGRTVTDELVGASAASTLIPVKRDGSFSATRNAVGDETGSKGTVRFKGIIDGIHASGTITAHMHYPVLGDCQGTGKFLSKGVRIA